jgi:HD-GYP domain-containing protein (c-di-GMP phosphodiesterase class II)
LAGHQIPLGARIIAISDSYDSMTSDRPYRKPLTNEEATKELANCAGKQFDPELVTIFLDILKELEKTFLTRNHVKITSPSYAMSKEI